MRKHKRLDRTFYTRTDVLQIGKDLLGKVLVSNIDHQISSGIIVETEAYRAPDDKACHAYLNRFTKRTSIMFEEGGHAYIYLCYGIHHLFNVVTASSGMAHVVLIRAIEPLENIKLMLNRRGLAQVKPQLTAGPGVMSKALGLSKKYNGIDLTSADSSIWIEDHGIEVANTNIIKSPRVGIDYAEECALWDWRFRIKNNPYTSKAR